MKKINDEKALFQQLLDLLENHFGIELEIVLHDLSSDLNHSITDIRNGNITRRKIGDMEERHGIQVLPGKNLEDGSLYGEIVYSSDGKIIKGSTMKIHGEDGSVIGSICLNQDITRSVEYEDYLRKKNGFHFSMQGSHAKDINTLLDNLIQQALIQTGKPYSMMNKEDKLKFIKYLDDRGAFLVSKSGPRICDTLKISKYTLYNYLEIIRSENHKNGTENQDLQE